MQYTKFEVIFVGKFLLVLLLLLFLIPKLEKVLLLGAVVYFLSYSIGDTIQFYV